jgi:hypothetical protein
MFRPIETLVWTDLKIHSFAPEGKLLFLDLVINQHAYITGVYDLPSVLIAHETGLAHDLGTGRR